MTKQSTSLNRRGFLKSTGAAAGAMALSARSYGRVIGANDRIRIGIIGCGGMSSGHLDALLWMREPDNIDVVAVTDIYRTHAKNFQERIQAKGGEASLEDDYKALLARGDIDKVLIATPEHTHAYLTLAAIGAGKHIYVEKPITRQINDANTVVKALRKTDLKLQVGVQGTADDSYSSAHTAILEGKIGLVVQAQIEYVRDHGEVGPWRLGDSLPRGPKPDDLDWNAWRKPLRRHDWDPHHYYEWRCYKEYSGGIATDLFIHRLTRILKACGLGFPERVAGMGGIYTWDDGRTSPDSIEMLAQYGPVKGITNGMTVHLLGTMANKRPIEHLIRGTEGTLYFTRGGWEIKPEGKEEAAWTHKKTGSESLVPHHENHHAAIRSGAELNCPAELGHYAIAAVEMANLSWEKGKMGTWNHRRMRPSF